MCRIMGFRLIMLAATLFSSLWVPPVHATVPSKVVVFGDSLSDTGNAQAKFAAAPAPFNLDLPSAPYASGHFSNGQVAVEVMASLLDVELQSFAFGGALTGSGNRISTGGVLNGTGVQSQVSSYLQVHGGTAESSALFVLWAGGNDLFSSPSLGTVATAVDNLVDEVNRLYSAGARQFLVVNLPDLADTADAIKAGGAQRDLAHGLTVAFNDRLRLNMTELADVTPDASLQVFDAFAVLKTVRSEMQLQGLNVSEPCYVGDYLGNGVACELPDAYFLWDSIHPTARVHQAMGEALAASVPEPASWALFGLGLALVALRLHPRQAGPQPRS